MKQISINDILSATQKEFDNTSIIAMYVFGSFVSQLMNDESDLDLGILFKNAPDLFDLSQKKSNIESALKIDIDFVIMNHASPIIIHQILKNGKLIINNDNYSLSLFIIKALNEYFDVKIIRQPIEEKMLGKLHDR